MELTHRRVTKQDFDVCYRAVYTTFGYGDEHRAGVQRELEALWNNPFTVAFVAEDRERPPSERAVGYTDAVFVSDAFVRRMRSGVEPYVNRQIVNALAAGGSPLLTEQALRRANSADGLNMLLTHTGWTEPPLTSEESTQVRAYMSRVLAEEMRGYNIKQAFVEVVGDEPLRRAQSAGFYLLSAYAAYYEKVAPPPAHLHPYLLGVTRAEALAQDGSLVSLGFCFTPPRFYFDFTESQRELLAPALTGATDDEIADALYITVAAVKKRWLAIYARMEEKAPALLPHAEGKRGAEKRQPLLNYLRRHPEELRPTNPPPNKKTKRTVP